MHMQQIRMLLFAVTINMFKAFGIKDILTFYAAYIL